MRMHRYMVTLRKVCEPSASDLALPEPATSAAELQRMAAPWERWWELPEGDARTS